MGAAGAVVSAAAMVDSLVREAAAVDAMGSFPVESFARLRKRGLIAAPVPEAYGGSGLIEPRFRLQLLEVLAHLGRGSLPVGRLYEGHVNALSLVAAFGTPAQQRRWFADAMSGRLFAVWNTEAADGVRIDADQHGVRTLNGSKTFASGAGVVDRAVVTGRDEQGRWLMAVLDLQRHAPAIDRSFWKPLGMRASCSFKVRFEEIQLSRDTILGEAGDYYREPEFAGGAVRFAAVQQGGIEAVFDATRVFLQDLGRTDDPFQRARLGEMAMLAAGGRQWLRAASRRGLALQGFHLPDDSAAAAAHAHLMRIAIEQAALRVLQLAERCVGARGLMVGEPLERLHRDLTHYLRQAGPDAAVASAGRYVLERREPLYALWQS